MKTFRFSPETSIGPVKKLSGALELNLSGTAHIDDLFYLFRYLYITRKPQANIFVFSKISFILE